MFIYNLTANEQSAFLGLADKIIQADGILALQEEQLFAYLSNATGQPAAEGTVESLAAVFQTRRSKASALLELMGLGLTDGRYHPAERTLVAEIAKVLGFNENELVGMENWVVRQAMLVEEATGFWNEDEGGK